MQNKTTPAERWLPVVDYEGLYEVSDRGRVRGLTRCERNITFQGVEGQRLRRGRLKTITPGRYASVHLCKNGIASRHLVHALVLAAFIGPRPPGLQAAHQDGDPTNNRLQNLRWATATENNRDKIRHGTIARGERNGRALLTPDDVRAIRASDASSRALARQYGVSRSCIRLIVKRINWRHI